jgi:hypothetical protein
LTRDELSQTITKSIGELGFARIAKPAVLDVFSTGEAVSFDVHDKLKEFAAQEKLEYRDGEDDQDFLVFRPADSK